MIKVYILIFITLSCNIINDVRKQNTKNDLIGNLSILLFLAQRNTTTVTGPAAIRVYGQNGSFTSNSANNGGVSANSLNSPNGVTIDSNNGLYITDSYNNRVLYFPSSSTTATKVYGQAGSFISRSLNNGGITADSLNIPISSIIDLNGGLYIVDSGNSRVLYYPSGSTTATKVYGQNGSFTSNGKNNGGVSANSLYFPYAVDVDSNGGVYIADSYNNRVLYYPSGSTTATRVYGQNGNFTSNSNNNGGISANSLLAPYSVKTDTNGGIYIADTLNSRVLYYPSGSTTATRVYGQNGSFSSGFRTDNIFSKNSLQSPFGLSLDSIGGIYTVDIGCHRALYYPSGSTSATKVWGQPNFTSCASSEGSVTASSLNYPQGIAVDSNNRIYIADRDNNRVLYY